MAEVLAERKDLQESIAEATEKLQTALQEKKRCREEGNDSTQLKKKVKRLGKRLKDLRQQVEILKPSKQRKQPFRWLLVLDFEATCAKNRQIQPQEIIEFPCIPLDLQTGEQLPKDKWFHKYVKPVHHPILTDFCTELTGIKQAVVDKADIILEVLEEFCQWMKANEFSTENSLIATCGDWDLKTLWPRQAALDDLPTPSIFRRFLNVMVLFNRAMGYRGAGMMQMLRDLELRHEGRHHSGLDDVRNIVRICQACWKRKAGFEPSYILQA